MNSHIEEIKNRIEYEAENFIQEINSEYNIKNLSPVLFNNIRDFILRKGKRLRPLLFILASKGYGKFPPDNIYKAALSMEFLHDFALIHDDIIDRSDIRSGKPTVRSSFSAYLANLNEFNFSGDDLAIIAGDILYALGFKAFMSLKAQAEKKEKALSEIIDTAITTGIGEFLELIYTIKSFDSLKLSDIFNVYDLKTSKYTFSCPLVSGAILSGAENSDIIILRNFAKYAGRAFQLNDDLRDIFGSINETGKQSFEDFRKSKKTVIMWHVWQRSAKTERSFISEILDKTEPPEDELQKLKEIVYKSRTDDFIRRLINKNIRHAEHELSRSNRKQFSETLLEYCKNIMKFNQKTEVLKQLQA